ncbi:hypothetical protein ACFL52_01630 [Candidatus Margulisiibacteriota bacterium]
MIVPKNTKVRFTNDIASIRTRLADWTFNTKPDYKLTNKLNILQTGQMAVSSLWYKSSPLHADNIYDLGSVREVSIGGADYEVVLGFEMSQIVRDLLDKSIGCDNYSVSDGIIYLSDPKLANNVRLAISDRMGLYLRSFTSDEMETIVEVEREHFKARRITSICTSDGFYQLADQHERISVPLQGAIVIGRPVKKAKLKAKMALGLEPAKKKKQKISLLAGPLVSSTQERFVGRKIKTLGRLDF